MSTFYRLSIALVPISLLLACLLWLLLFVETRLVYPAPQGGNAVANDFGADECFFAAEDGTGLHAWFFERPEAERALVFFHGNGECIETCGPRVGKLAEALNASVLIFDYRGYGKSDGNPVERGVVQDGVAAVDWFCERTGKNSDEVVFLGYSIGGGVAIQVAKQRPPQAFVIVASFSSLVDVAADLLPWLPVRMLMENRYESEKTLATLDIPLQQIHGARDRLVPLRLAERLFAAAAASQKQLTVVPDKGHNDLDLSEFVPTIKAFLDKIAP